MALARRKILLLAADDFEDMELLYPLYRLREEDATVTVAGLDDQPVTGRRATGRWPWTPPWTGWPRRTSTRSSSRAVSRPTSCGARRRCSAWCGPSTRPGKPIAFICHAGWVPISAKILKGRRATSVAAIRDDMVNAGTDWVDQATVVDGNLISARTPADLGPWMKALLAALESAG